MSTPETNLTVTSVDASGRFELVQELELVTLSAAARPVHVLRGRTTIGSSELADLVLADPAVSRLHCEIRIESGRVRLRDLGSRNGTRVNGVAVLDGYLDEGAVIRVGTHELQLRVGGVQQRVELATSLRFGGLAGRSLAMRRMFAQLEQVAPTDSTILLTGETGCGKEIAADAIHEASLRSAGPLVVVDCGATPADLLESELFGHERGSFTSASSTRLGAFEAAAGGTVFLDEIGELPLQLQPKLLRVLAQREIKRIGRNEYRPIDVRVIAATNRELREEVERKSFRADLYFRLAVVEIHLPPLRERLEDLDLLVADLLEDMHGAPAVRDRLLSNDSLARMSRYAWPGNVRELRNYLERSVAAGEPGTLADRPVTTSAAAAPDPPGPVRTIANELLGLPFREAKDVWTADFERQYLEHLLSAHGGNIRAAAATAGIDRVYLYRLLWRHGLRAPPARATKGRAHDAE